jgi:hypothetical protein
MRRLALLLFLCACGAPRPGPDDAGEDAAADAGDDAGAVSDAGMDADADAGADDGGATPHPPRAEVTTPAAGTGDIPIAYALFDDDSDAITIVVETSEDGATWRNATAAPGSTKVGLTSSPAGAAHEFVWRSKTDMADRLAQVRVRIKPFDGTFMGEAAATGAFAVDNRTVVPTTGVRITEVGAGSPNWIEITNTSDATVQMESWTLKAEGVELGLDTIAMTAGRRVTLIEGPGDSDTMTRYLGGEIGWRPARPGSAALLDDAGQGVDFVRWEGSATAPPAGTAFAESAPLYLAHGEASLVRTGGVDTDRSEDFCQAPATRTNTDANCYEAPPQGATARLLRIRLGGPSAGHASLLEIRNTGSVELVLDNWSFTAPQTAERLSGTLAPGDQGGLGAPYWDWPPHEPGAASLRDPTGRPHDFVRWGDSDQTPPPPLQWSGDALHPPGKLTTLVRRPDSPSAIEPAAWCVGRGPPATAADGCLPTAAGSGLRLNELVFSSTAPSLELLHKGASDVWLGDFALRWSAAEDGVAYIEEDLTIAAAARALLGAGAMPWGGAAAGSLEVVDNTGRSVDFVRWGGSAAQPSAGGQWTDAGAPIPQTASGDALGRLEWESDTDSAGDWCKQAPTPGQLNGICQ